MPEFTIDWTDQHTAAWEHHLGFIGKRDEAHGLEIGCLEGKSTLWFCEHLLQQPNSTMTCIDPYDYSAELAIATNTPRIGVIQFDVQAICHRFKANTADLRESGKINFLQLGVPAALRRIPLIEQFDFVYIDGCHLASAVLSDAVHVWPYLRPHGIMIFDDIGWTVKTATFPPEVWPAVAMGAFKDCFAGRCRELGRNSMQMFLEKLV